MWASAAATLATLQRTPPPAATPSAAPWPQASGLRPAARASCPALYAFFSMMLRPVCAQRQGLGFRVRALEYDVRGLWAGM